MKILLVDDEINYQFYLAELARGRGCHIISAGDPIQAQQVAIRERPDLIILDINMPAGGGKSAYKRLKQSTLTRNIPIIIVSASDKEEFSDLIEEFRIDSKNVFQKPIDEELFMKRLEELCPKKTAEPQ